MTRPRAPEKVRKDALRVGIEKLKDGCDDCARTYFQIARDHGASEEEVRMAITQVVAEASSHEVNRRAFLVSAAAGAVTFAAAATIGKAGAVPALAQSIPTQDSIWVIAVTDAGQRVAYVLSRTGSITTQVNLGDAGLLRSRDDLQVYGIRSEKEGATAFAVVETYDSQSGSLLHTTRGQGIDLGHVTGRDMISVSLSPEGKYLALLHQAGFVIEPSAHQVTKVRPDGSLWQISIDDVVYRSSVEILSLEANQSLDILHEFTPPDTIPGGRVDFGSDSGTLSVFTANKDGRESLAVLSFDGTRLTLSGHASDGDPGHLIPTSGLPYKDRVQPLMGGAVLVRLAHSSTVHWVDVQRQTLKASLDVAPEILPAKAESSIRIFSADATTLFVVNTWRGDVEKINLAQESRVATLILPYQRSVTGVSRPAPSLQGAALSPDGQLLYIRSGTTPGGYWIIATKDMTILANPLSGLAVHALWVTSDGASVVVAEGDRNRVLVLNANGVLSQITPLPAQPAAFADTFLPMSI